MTSTLLDRAAQHTLRQLAAVDIPVYLHALTELLREAVNAGGSLGFLPPLEAVEARQYWLALRQELNDGSRILLAAFVGGRLVGSGQLAMPAWQNGRHRAELQKLMVASALQGQSIGGSLVEALHTTARRHGRTLLVLHTRHGEPPESFYRRRGYRTVGLVPGYTIGPAGEAFNSALMFTHLEG
ncbi:MAG: GNAT family N-acetyltransferase [Gemmatimonadales bacterium]